MGGQLSPSQIDSAGQSDQAALSSQGNAGNVVQTCPKVTLEIGVFFDGTGNNEMNAQVGGGAGEGSYSNSLTNVSLVKDLYYPGGDRYDERNACGGYAKRYYRLYVQGIGTDEGEEDDTLGSAMGVGPRGVENRVIRAAIEVGHIINRLSPGVEPEEVVLDVFGFSRGAAAARHFVNGFNAGRLDYTRWGLFNDVHARLPEGRNVRLRFLGIFDTVAAILADQTADNGDVDVHLKSSSAETIFHISAKDEIRHNFSLNDNQPGGGEVKRMNGVHSNIGGGYHQNFTERPVIKPPDTGMATSHAGAVAEQRNKIAQLRASALSDASVYISEGWITAADLPVAWELEAGPIVPRVIGASMFGGGNVFYEWSIQTRLNRPWIRHELSRLALKEMYDKAAASGVPLEAMPSNGDYEIPADLLSASDATIKRDFTHYSSNHNFILPIFGSPMKERAGRVRKVHPNNTGMAK